MLSLKEARKKAAEIGKVPAYNTLGNWVTKKIISGSIEKEYKGKAGGVRGLYPERIAGEIIAAQRLKSKYSLSEIVKARELLELNVKKEVEIIYIKQKLQSYKEKIDNFEPDKIRSYLVQTNEEGDYNYNIDELSKRMEKLKDLKKQFQLLKDYVDQLIKALNELEEVEN